MNPVLQEARGAIAAGMTIFPILPADEHGEKVPAIKWRNIQAHQLTDAQLISWFETRSLGLGLATGEASGVVMVEIEGRAAHRLSDLTQTATALGVEGLWVRASQGWFEQTPSGGFHWYVRVPGVDHRNTKLASRPATLEELATNPQEKRKTLAETRGTGGYSVIAPTPKQFSKLGCPWRRLTGGPSTVATLSPHEFDALLNIFRSLDEQPEPVVPTLPPTMLHAPTRPTDGRRRPGDQWAEETPWEAILTPHGWTLHHQDASATYWTRPGKTPTAGASATTRPDGNLYVFSTSTEFDTEVPLSKLFVLAHYEHGGDMRAAAKALAARGFGDALSEVTIDLPTTPPRPRLHVIEGTSALHTDPDPTPAIQVKHSGDLTEASAGRYIADAYHQHVKYVANSGRWLHWNGHAWKQQGKSAAPVKQLAIQAIEVLPTATKEEANYRRRLLSSAGINATIALAATDPRIIIDQKQLDAHHGELNTPTGIVNLHSGKLSAPNPGRLHTRTTLVAPKGDPTPLWNQFLTETFAGHNQELLTYVQQLAGYAATGYVGSQILPFLHGAGANGKSVLAEVVQRLLADYAEPAPANFLMQTSQQHPTEIARLHGARLVIASEVPEGAKFDEVKVKQLTGGDTLTARYMGGDFFTFQPTHKLWLLGNHQPKVSAGGYSFWRRLRQIPFTNIVPEGKRDEELVSRLIEEEGAGILAWIIQGAVTYLAGGLQEPAEVLEATKAYEESEDHLRRFVADRLNVGGGDMVRVAYKDMRHEYTNWCRLEGQQPATANAFTREVQLRFGIGTVKSNGVRYYTNATILADADESENESTDVWGDLGGGGRR